MPVIIDPASCGITIPETQLDFQAVWSDTTPQSNLNYWVRVTDQQYTGVGTGGSFYYSSGLLPSGTTTTTITTTPFNPNCNFYWLTVSKQVPNALDPSLLDWEHVSCEIEVCALLVVNCVADAYVPTAAPPIQLSGCPTGEVASGQSINLQYDNKQPSPPITSIQSWTYADPTLGVIPEGNSFANDPSYTPPPTGSSSWQLQYNDSQFFGKGGFFNIAGQNDCMRLCYWTKLPEFSANQWSPGDQFGVQGDVIYYKWGVGFFPCETDPRTGYGNTQLSASDGTNGWSYRHQAYQQGYNSLPYPSAPNLATVDFYLYHADRAGQPGAGPPPGETTTYTEMPVDEWVYMEELICMNTVGNNDGYVKTWVNGQLVVSYSNVRWTDNPDLLSVNRISLLAYHGGSVTAPSDGFHYIADLKFSVNDAAKNECEWQSVPAIQNTSSCTTVLESAPADGEYTVTLSCLDGSTQQCSFRVGPVPVGCLEPIVNYIVNGQSTITNPNDTPLTVTISSGSATFQNPIPANSTVIVTNIVGGDGVNAAGEAIKTFCITGNC